MAHRRHRISAAVLALVAVAALTSAQFALATFTHSATGGPLTVASATFAAPGGLTAAQVNCRSDKNPEIFVNWNESTSSYVTSYTVERATASAGPYTAIASTSSSVSEYTDKSNSLEYATTYYYRVSAIDHSWSATSAVVSVKTLNKLCLAL